MGMSGEHVAELYGVSREAQDRYAAESHRKAARAAAAGRFTAEITRVEVPQPKGSPIVFDRDETIRPDSTVEVLKALKPAFKKDGSVTAGNAPGVNDGAAALVVMSDERATALGLAPMARIAGYATSGLAPKLLLMTPVESIRRLLKRTGWRLEDVDLFESTKHSPRRWSRSSRSWDSIRRASTQRRRDCARSPDRLERRAGADDSALPMKERVRAEDRLLCLGGGNGVALAVERNNG